MSCHMSRVTRHAAPNEQRRARAGAAVYSAVHPEQPHAGACTLNIITITINPLHYKQKTLAIQPQAPNITTANPSHYNPQPLSPQTPNIPPQAEMHLLALLLLCSYWKMFKFLGQVGGNGA